MAPAFIRQRLNAFESPHRRTAGVVVGRRARLTLARTGPQRVTVELFVAEPRARVRATRPSVAIDGAAATVDVPAGGSESLVMPVSQAAVDAAIARLGLR